MDICVATISFVKSSDLISSTLLKMYGAINDKDITVASRNGRVCSRFSIRYVSMLCFVVHYLSHISLATRTTLELLYFAKVVDQVFTNCK